MNSDLRDFLEIPYDRLEEKIRDKRMKYLAD